MRSRFTGQEITSDKLQVATLRAEEHLLAPSRPCQRCGAPIVMSMHVYTCGYPKDCRARAEIKRPICPAFFLNDPEYRHVILNELDMANSR